MKFKIHHSTECSEDNIFIEGETIEEVRNNVFKEMDARGWAEEDCWSERVEES